MRVRDRIVKAARKVAASERDVSIAHVARAAGVSWPTANRHLGGKPGLDALLGAHPKPAVPSDARARLVAAFARCVAELGVEGAALDDVATEAGVTKGSLYWHFDTKLDLLRALIAERVPTAGGARTISAIVLSHLARPASEHALDLELAAAARTRDVRPALTEQRAAFRREISASLGVDDDGATVVLAILDGLSIARRLDPDLDAERVVTAMRALLRDRRRA